MTDGFAPDISRSDALQTASRFDGLPLHRVSDRWLKVVSSSTLMPRCLTVGSSLECPLNTNMFSHQPSLGVAASALGLRLLVPVNKRERHHPSLSSWLADYEKSPRERALRRKVERPYFFLRRAPTRPTMAKPARASDDGSGIALGASSSM
jgi:hypothetical protein